MYIMSSNMNWRTQNTSKQIDASVIEMEKLTQLFSLLIKIDRRIKSQDKKTYDRHN